MAIDTICLFGTISIPRVKCPECGELRLVVGGETACCGVEVSVEASYFTRISEPPEVRRKPPLKDRRRMMADQSGCCFWCGFMIGSYRTYHGRKRTTRLHWDHLLPWSYSQDNRADNFVASCNLCNQIKHNRVFATVEECRALIEKAYLDDRGVPGLPEEV